MSLDFLKDILGEELFGQFMAKLNEHNGNEANKDKQIKLANLTDGGYVSKDKYTALETSLNGKNSELETANSLIADLKKSAGKDSELKGKITAYEAQITELQAENSRLKCENALKFALIEAGATDIDYAFFKAMEKLKADGKTLELGDDEKVKGVDDLIAGLKIQLPGQFESANSRKIEEKKLEKPDDSSKVSKDDFGRMGYQERLKLYNENPEQYKVLAGSN